MKEKRLIKILIIISLINIIIFAAIQIRKTLARYETETTAERKVDVAFWIVDNSFKSERLLIDEGIYPSNTPFEYDFTVSNFEDTKTAETDLEYEIVLTATTNLPLSYEIVKVTETGEIDSATGKPIEKETPCTIVDELYEDTDKTVYREIRLETDANNLIMSHSTQTTDKYRIKVTFPESYNTNSEYADLMEDIKLDLTARQVIE